MTTTIGHLSSVAIFLRASETRALPESLGRSLHAQFFSMLEEADSGLAKRLHDEDDLKPFSLSNLHTKIGMDSDGERYIEEGTSARWRVCCLDECVLAAFLQTLTGMKMNARPITLGSAPFEIQRFATTARESVRWAAATTPAQLLAQAARAREVTVEFLSPTSFRRGGVQVLFPEASMVMGSWARRWESVSGPAIPGDFLRAVADGIFVARYRLQTQIIPFDRYMITGFVGTITFEAGKTVSDENVKWMNALADFSFFAGTGYKTTMGLGETRRLSG